MPMLRCVLRQLDQVQDSLGLDQHVCDVTTKIFGYLVKLINRKSALFAIHVPLRNTSLVSVAIKTNTMLSVLIYTH